MKILYYDCFSGISGDMNLAAMIDLGLDKNFLLSELKKLKLSGYTIRFSKEQRSGITGTRVDVITDPSENQIHRNLSDIEKIIDTSDLNKQVKSLSKRIFQKLGKAEAHVHNKPISKIHFHEVGAIDSIIDIVGAAICYDYFQFDKIFASSVELGGGFIKASHGVLPVPAPATVEILKNIPTKIGGANFETTTPTGAAILSTLVNDFTDKIEMVIHKTGYGIGHKVTESPNLLRVYVGETDSVKNSDKQKESEACMIECNIDDMNPEWYDFIMEKLFDQGVQDVFFTPLMMKKNRPAIKISVLCSPDQMNKVKELLFIETTTLGLRTYKVDKTALERKLSKLATDYGEVTIKSCYYQNKLLHSKPEYEDCKQIAKERNIPIREVIEHINALLI
ncbi:MAG: nickel pincer cofactor biosynthesis protein LarC [Bacteroidales bacterium]|nr:nickel pincer cofactor biosynthesis protein LarC [Bacteroidales bacterium]